jgi:hypothetical protein
MRIGTGYITGPLDYEQWQDTVSDLLCGCAGQPDTAAEAETGREKERRGEMKYSIRNRFIGTIRAANALEKSGILYKRDIRVMSSDELWRKVGLVRGVGLKTIQEICKWAGVDAPVSYRGPFPSERRKRLNKDEKRDGVCIRYLTRRGYTVSKRPQEAR